MKATLPQITHLFKSYDQTLKLSQQLQADDPNWSYLIVEVQRSQTGKTYYCIHLIDEDGHNMGPL
jgi:acyl-CoA thioesterase